MTTDTPKASDAPNTKPTPKKEKVLPPARAATVQKRHKVLVLSFFVFVLLPTIICGIYLYTRAADQYVTVVGFSVRNEDAPSAVELLGGITTLGSGGSSDSDILYEFIQSQELVRFAKDKINLDVLYSRPEKDFFFKFHPDGKIEDLHQYWKKMVKIHYNSATKILELRVYAFTPEDAKLIAETVFSESSRMINNLAKIARADATEYAHEELEKSIARLKVARKAITTFRNKTQIVDPSADIQGQMGVLTSLQQKLVEATIERDLLPKRKNDPRMTQITRKIEVIKKRIAVERQKFGLSGANDDGDFSALIEEYEALSVDLEFAQQTYLGSLANYDSSVAEAHRKNRYLAAHINPTLAEKSLHPKRSMIVSIIALFLFLIWSVLVLIYFSIRDRR